MENANKVKKGKGIKPKVIWVRQPSRDTTRIMTHNEKVSYIIDRSLEYLSLDRKYIEQTREVSKSFSVDKRYMIPVLYDYTKANMLEIASLLGYKSHGIVSYHYRVLKEELGATYGCDKTKMVYRELLMYLGIDSEGHIKKQETHEETEEDEQ